MAEVFLAKAAGPGGFEKRLVLKRIRPQFAERRSFVQMFLNEARIAAQFDHQNIVQIFDFGEAEGAHYLAMEFVDGLDLRSLLRWAKRSGEALNFALLARIISLACDGLAYAHEFVDPQTGEELELIHRDVSPENIMVSRGGAVKVLDFGVARVAGSESQTRVGTLKGKIAYMPREQVIGQSLDLRIDVYALGAVMYQLLTGHKPYGVHDEVRLIAAILNGPPPPLRERNPLVPPELAAIVERAMAYDRDQRYGSCRELHAALERYLLSTGQAMGAAQLAQLVVRVQESGLVSSKLSWGAGSVDASKGSGDPASGQPSSDGSSAREAAARRFPVPLGEEDPEPTESGAPPVEPAPTAKLRPPREDPAAARRAAALTLGVAPKARVPDGPEAGDDAQVGAVETSPSGPPAPVPLSTLPAYPGPDFSRAPSPTTPMRAIASSAATTQPEVPAARGAAFPDGPEPEAAPSPSPSPSSSEAAAGRPEVALLGGDGPPSPSDIEIAVVEDFAQPSRAEEGGLRAALLERSDEGAAPQPVSEASAAQALARAYGALGGEQQLDAEAAGSKGDAESAGAGGVAGQNVSATASNEASVAALSVSGAAEGSAATGRGASTGDASAGGDSRSGATDAPSNAAAPAAPAIGEAGSGATDVASSAARDASAGGEAGSRATGAESSAAARDASAGGEAGSGATGAGSSAAARDVSVAREANSGASDAQSNAAARDATAGSEASSVSSAATSSAGARDASAGGEAASASSAATSSAGAGEASAGGAASSVSVDATSSAGAGDASAGGAASPVSSDATSSAGAGDASAGGAASPVSSDATSSAGAGDASAGGAASPVSSDATSSAGARDISAAGAASSVSSDATSSAGAGDASAGGAASSLSSDATSSAGVGDASAGGEAGSVSIAATSSDGSAGGEVSSGATGAASSAAGRDASVGGEVSSGATGAASSAAGRDASVGGAASSGLSSAAAQERSTGHGASASAQEPERVSPRTDASPDEVRRALDRVTDVLPIEAARRASLAQAVEVEQVELEEFVAVDFEEVDEADLEQVAADDFEVVQGEAEVDEAPAASLPPMRGLVTGSPAALLPPTLELFVVGSPAPSLTPTQELPAGAAREGTGSPAPSLTPTQELPAGAAREGTGSPAPSLPPTQELPAGAAREGTGSPAPLLPPTQELPAGAAREGTGSPAASLPPTQELPVVGAAREGTGSPAASLPPTQELPVAGATREGTGSPAASLPPTRELQVAVAPRRATREVPSSPAASLPPTQELPVVGAAREGTGSPAASLPPTQELPVAGAAREGTGSPAAWLPPTRELQVAVAPRRATREVPSSPAASPPPTRDLPVVSATLEAPGGPAAGLPSTPETPVAGATREASAAAASLPPTLETPLSGAPRTTTREMASAASLPPNPETPSATRSVARELPSAPSGALPPNPQTPSAPRSVARELPSAPSDALPPNPQTPSATRSVTREVPAPRPSASPATREVSIAPAAPLPPARDPAAAPPRPVTRELPVPPGAAAAREAQVPVATRPPTREVPAVVPGAPPQALGDPSRTPGPSPAPAATGTRPALAVPSVWPLRDAAPPTPVPGSRRPTSELPMLVPGIPITRRPTGEIAMVAPPVLAPQSELRLPSPAAGFEPFDPAAPKVPDPAAVRVPAGVLVHQSVWVASSQGQEALRQAAAADRTRHLARKFFLLAARLLEGGAEPAAPLREALAALVDAALLGEDYALLKLVLERTALQPRFTAVLQEELCAPLRMVWLSERLRSPSTLDLVGLEGLLSQLGAALTPQLLWALESSEPGEAQDLFCRQLAPRLAIDPTPVLERLEQAPLPKLAAWCQVLELSQAPERLRAFHKVLGRRDAAVTVQVMTGRARARTAEAITTLEAGLGDKLEEVRRAALRLLGELPDGRAAAVLAGQVTPAFESKPLAERAAVWAALASTQAPVARAILEQAIAQKLSLLSKRKGIDARLGIVEGLAQARGDLAGAMLQRLAQDKAQPDEVLTAVRAAVTKRQSPPAEAPRLNSERRRTLLRAVVLDYFHLVRSAGVTDLGQSAFEPGLLRLREGIRQLLSQDSRFELVASSDGISVNGALVPMGHPEEVGLVMARALNARDVKGLELDAPIPASELKVAFLRQFDPARGQAPVKHVHFTTFSTRAPMPPVAALHKDAAVQVRALLGTAVTALKRQRELVLAGQQPVLGELTPALEELAALYAVGGPLCLSIIPADPGADDFALPALNTALLSACFAGDLGLGPVAARELLELGLFSTLGAVGVPPERRTAPGEAPPDEARVRVALWHLAQQKSQRGLAFALACVESGLPTNGDSARVLGVQASILALAQAWDALALQGGEGHARALELMNGRHRKRFHPELLGLFTLWANKQLAAVGR